MSDSSARFNLRRTMDSAMPRPRSREFCEIALDAMNGGRPKRGCKEKIGSAHDYLITAGFSEKGSIEKMSFMRSGKQEACVGMCWLGMAERDSAKSGCCGESALHLSHRRQRPNSCLANGILIPTLHSAGVATSHP